MSSFYHGETPVVIGGLGGSGTRLIAKIIKELGYFIGDDLNESYDNLWFTLMFKRTEILAAPDDEFEELLGLFLKGMKGDIKFSESEQERVYALSRIDRELHPASWLKERARSIIAHNLSCDRLDLYGWKEPNSHIVIDRLVKFLPHMRYIHVIRNGLDMAHSRNQNQLSFWGKYFIGENCQITPYFSLKYWHIINRRVMELCKPMGDRFLLLDYDKLCTYPEKGLRELLEFLEFDAPDIHIRDLTNVVEYPKSIGRFRQHGMHIYDPDDVVFVKDLGFDVDVV